MLVAVTGGIGSGKSEILKILKEHTDNVLSADEINAALLNDRSYISKISDIFPETVIDGVIDKKLLSAIIFGDKEKREELNGAAHPVIMQTIFKRAAAMKGDVFAEVPLLAETGMRGSFDRVWLVVSPIEVKTARLKTTRGMSDGEILSIMNAQCNDEKRGAIADDIIENDGNLTVLKTRVELLYAALHT
ncbi:MAG: dephospho-CoA kinase [Clostridiales bacterium]|jgi:dephospho-CoA kinase|nr:dephospho-CoA kinase [Clostridiales bacterium]